MLNDTKPNNSLIYAFIYPYEIKNGNLEYQINFFNSNIHIKFPNHRKILNVILELFRERAFIISMPFYSKHFIKIQISFIELIYSKFFEM